MQLLYDYAFRFVGIPYKYGGQSPMEGLDCSSLMRWLLKAGGITLEPPSNAQGIHDQLVKNNKTDTVGLGTLIFYGTSISEIVHVGMALDEWRHIEAAGGSSGTLSQQLAITRAAFVRITPIRHEQRIAVVNPDYPFKTLP